MADIIKILAECGMNITRMNNGQVFAPVNIVKDMIDLLPSDIYRPDMTFLDPVCKSGRFLIEIKDRLMASESMVQAFPSEEDRLHHILTKQLYGIALSETAASLIRKSLYENPLEYGNICTIQGYIEELNKSKTNYKMMLKNAFGINCFDVIIGNAVRQTDKQHYYKLMLAAHKVSGRFVGLIVDNTCLSKDNSIKNMLFSGKGCRHIIEYPIAGEKFDIDIGISYYLEDKMYKGNCEYKKIENGTVTEFQILD